MLNVKLKIIYFNYIKVVLLNIYYINKSNYS